MESRLLVTYCSVVEVNGLNTVSLLNKVPTSQLCMMDVLQLENPVSVGGRWMDAEHGNEQDDGVERLVSSRQVQGELVASRGWLG